MAKQSVPIVKRSLLSWAFARNRKFQVILVAIVTVLVVVRVFPLEMQKRIINQAVGMKAFDKLVVYCFLYLVAVLLASALKLIVGYLQTLIAQRTVAAMRKELYAHILKLPVTFYRRTQPGMVVQSFVSEIATAGEFIGAAVAVPLTSLFSLIAFVGYLALLEPWLALVSFSIYPLALFLIPWLQKQANLANQKRVDLSREFSGRLAETVSGINDIQAYGANHIETRKFKVLVDQLKKVRIVWQMYRQGIKVGSNFFTSFSPFLIFILGGYLAINGRLELGALVAFLSAQEKLFDPWREMIDVYQAYQDASVSYARTMEYFDVEIDPAFMIIDRMPLALQGPIEVKNLSYAVESGYRLLDNVSFTIEPGQQFGLVGFSGSGKSTLAQCIGQLSRYTGGHITLAGKDLTELTKRDIAASMSIVSQSPFIFDGSLEENLLYGCVAKADPRKIDLPAELPSRDEKIEILQQTVLFPDVLRFGLNSVLDLSKNMNLIPQLLQIRKKLRRRLPPDLLEHIEFFEKNTFLNYASVAKNISFGSANDPDFAEKVVYSNPYFLDFLEEQGLDSELTDFGRHLCIQTMDVLDKMPGDNTLFEQSPIAAEELEDYRQLMSNLKKTDRHDFESVQKILALALRFTPGIHKTASLPKGMQKKLLGARNRFREKISNDLPDAISFFSKWNYINSNSILSNIFFGRLKQGNSKVQDAIDEHITRLLINEDLLEVIIEVGMQYRVGNRGGNLSGGQRQKLAIARALLKKPAILIMDESTSALDNNSQARIQKILDTQWKGDTTLIAVAHRLDVIKNFDKIGVMKAGKIVEMGTYAELMSRKGYLYDLAMGSR